MPKPAKVHLGAEEATRALADALAETRKPSPDCERVVRSLTLAIPVAAPEVSDATFPYYHALQHCAAATKRWLTVLQTSEAMLKLGARGRPDLLVHAYVRLGEFDKAAANLARLAKAFPDGEAGFMAEQTELDCAKQDWKRCLATAEKALARLEKTDPDLKGEWALKNRIWRGIARLFLGQLDAAESDFVAIDQVAAGLPDQRAAQPIVEFTKTFHRKVAEARENHLVLDINQQPEIALGVYHLFGTPRTGAPVEVRFYNLAATPRQLRIEAELTGITEPLVKTLTLLPHAQREEVFLVPQLKLGFDLSSVRSSMPVQVHLKVSELGAGGERLVYEDTTRSSLLPRDFLPLKRKLGADFARQTPEYIGAWITPNARAVEAFLTAAKQRAPRKLFVGEQDRTVEQVRAIYDELKARGVSYVMDPTIDTDLVGVQRTRLPSEVLTSTNAQCLEGTILFASLMESIGLRPIIVLVPHHAFVGWHTVPADGFHMGKVAFVETTKVGTAPFDDAVAAATARFWKEMAAGSFDDHSAVHIDVTDLRKLGFQPQPVE
jgi:hypothetical protein